MKKTTLLAISLLLIILCFNEVNATEITFKCYPGEINTEQDSIVYNYDAIKNRFAQDFTLYQVNNPDVTNRKKQFIKTDINKIGWRLWDRQAIHIYSKDNVTAITQIDILCEGVDYVDKLLKSSAGTVSYIGDLIVRITIPHTENVTDLQIFRGGTAEDKAEKFRPQEITINYLVTGETYEIPIPLPTQFEPLADTYHRPWDVKFYTAEPNAQIFYTTDGTEPTTSSTLYTAPVYFDTDTQVKAITFKNGVASEVITGQFNIREMPDNLEASETYLIDFPNLARTADDYLAMAQVNMPENFDPSKKHPLFVWFNGGNGSNATNVPKKIIKDNKDFILVGLPYQDWDHPLGGGWRTPWDYHKTMLDSIGKLIPNVDKDRRIVGGFSSGGAMVTRHINFSNLAFQNYFTAFLPSGSAPYDYLTDGVPTSIMDKTMLISVGANDPRSPFVGQYYELVNQYADAEFYLVDGLGHSIHNSQFVNDYIREWIYVNVMVGSDLLSTNDVDKNGFEMRIKGRALEINNLNDFEGVSIHVSNILGQKLQIESVTSNNTSIPLGQDIKPNTIHIVSVLKYGKFIYNKKFVLMN